MATKTEPVPILLEVDPPCKAPSPAEFERRRVTEQRKQVGPPEELVKRFDEFLQDLLRKDARARDAIVEMFAEGDEQEATTDLKRLKQRTRRHVLAVIDRPRLGMTNAQWKQTVRCITYMVYDKFKHVYGYQHFFDYRTQRGCVVAVDPNSSDGDWCFNIGSINPEWTFKNKRWTTLHCEITPCDRSALQPFINELLTRWDKFKQGQGPQPRVELEGTVTWDAEHSGNRASLEIHPVKRARFI